MLRRIPLGKMNNLRDLGGYPAAGGRMTAWERLLRGDNPAGLTGNDIQWLSDRAVTTIIDLRSTAEVNKTPDQLASISEFRYYHCPLLGGEEVPKMDVDVGRGYFKALDHNSRVRDVLGMIAEAPDGVLFHCTAGKDRTGMIAALLLSIAGVEREDILADYQVSEIYLAEIICQIKTFVPDLAPFAGQSRCEYMADCLDLLRTEYGSIHNYFRAIGLGAEELKILKSKVLA